MQKIRNVNQSFLQHALFCHVCKRSLICISVETEMAEEGFYDLVSTRSELRYGALYWNRLTHHNYL